MSCQQRRLEPDPKHKAEAVSRSAQQQESSLLARIASYGNLKARVALLGMAAPGETTIHNLSGQWTFASAPVVHDETRHSLITTQNHALSNDVSAAMAVQGVNFILRTALSRAPISLSIEQTRDAATGEERLFTRQSTIGRTVEEERALNWEAVATPHVIFGDVKTKARISAVHEITNMLLRDGWEEQTEELIEVQSQGSGWTSWQAWGFEVIDGKRHHVRRAVLQRGAEFQEEPQEPVVVRMVYDWVG